MFQYRESIVELESFQEVFETIRKKDPIRAENIEESIKAVLKDIRRVLANPKVGKESLINALLMEQINMQALAGQYLNVCEHLTEKGNGLWQFALTAPDYFFDTVFDLMDSYFTKKKELMYNCLTKDNTWYTGFKDTAKKGGLLVNKALSGLNELSQKYAGKKIADDTEPFSGKTIVEELLEKHLNPKKIGNDVSKMVKRASEKFEEAWMDKISVLTPDLGRICAFTLAQEAGSAINMSFQLGKAEQTLAVGLGTALAATFGLAAGWHTLAYAMLNVFPPIAVVAAIFTAITGYASREDALEQRKQQINQAVDQYHRFFLTHLEITPLKELNNLSLRKHVHKVCEQIVKDTVGHWEASILGELNIEDYRMLNTAFTRHLMLIQQALEELKEEYPLV